MGHLAVSRSCTATHHEAVPVPAAAAPAAARLLRFLLRFSHSDVLVLACPVQSVPPLVCVPAAEFRIDCFSRDPLGMQPPVLNCRSDVEQACYTRGWQSSHSTAATNGRRFGRLTWRFFLCFAAQTTARKAASRWKRALVPDGRVATALSATREPQETSAAIGPLLLRGRSECGSQSIAMK